MTAEGHSGRFSVGPANGDQLLFVASQWGVPKSPAELDRALVRLTVSNDGPRSVRIFWDQPPPDYAGGGAPTQQDALIRPGEGTAVTACRSVKIAYEPTADTGIAAAGASGTYIASWCCPPAWGAGVTQAWGVPAQYPPPPPVPSVTLFDPVDLVGPQVPVRFVLSNPTNQPCDVSCEYSRDGGSTWTAASAASGSDATATLPAPYLGADYRFMWDALTDIGLVKASDNVSAIFRIIPFNGGLSGDIGQSSAFQLDTTSKSALQLPAVKQPVRVGAIQIDPQSNNQKGISGQLLPLPLRAQVFDQNNAPIAGARVTFTIKSPAPPPPGAAPQFSLERDPAASTTTDAQGWTSMFLRASPGATAANGVVEIRIAGADPTLVGQINFTVEQARILTDPDPNLVPHATISYGMSFDVRVGLVGTSGTLNDPLPYLPEPAKPVKLLVTSSGLQLSHQEIHLPAPDGSDPVTFTVALIDAPSTGATVSPVELTISSPDPNSNISPVKLWLNPNRLSKIQRNSAVAAGGAIQTTDVYPFAKPDAQKMPTWPLTLVGYPGLTLKQQFQIQLTDTAGHPYKSELTAASPASGCNGQPPPATQNLSVQWSCNGGLFSVTGGAQKNPLLADIGQPVSFQPSKPGPWIIQAQTNGNGNPTYDDLHLSMDYADPANPSNNFCDDEYSIAGLSGSFTFIVQEATQARLAVVGAAPAANPYVKVKTGDRVKLEISGLSDISGGTPDQITLSALNANLGKPGEDGPNGAAYTGIPFDFEGKLDMAFDQGTLRSTDILFIPSDPESPLAAGHLQPVIPRGWLRAQADGFAFHLPVDGPHAARRLIDGVESMQQSPVGASMAAGAAGAVLVHNGEFSYGAVDFALPTRAGNMTLGRVFRGHLDFDGVLGPGWSFEHQSLLDVSSMAFNRTRAYGYLRWIAFGRYDDYDFDVNNGNFRPPNGFFLDVNTNSAIDADTSAFEIKDPHQTVMHFHPDGALRFIKDRLGNKTTYAYNEKSQLISVTGPNDRKIEFHYRPDGKLDSATALNRTINFDYYPATSSGEIRLKSVTLPPAPTLLSSAQPGDDPNPSYRRSETYTYSDGQIATIVDSEGRTWLDMSQPGSYDQQNRVVKQLYGGGQQPFVFDYSTALTTKLIDRSSQQTSYQFERSPLPDGACAVQYQDEKQNKTTFSYNLDGHLTSITSPLGDETHYVYDDDPAKTQPRQRGNLLTVMRMKPGTADARAWTYEYDGQFNLVYRAVGPRGNAPGANPQVYATSSLFDVYVTPAEQLADPDLVAGSLGLVARISRPRAIHMTVVPGASGLRMNWVDANPDDVYKYNKFGLCYWHRDPQGVVTRYTYYPDKTPTSGADSPDAGGFLATETRDAENNWLRDTVFFTQAPKPDPRVTRWEYDDLGHAIRITDNAGDVTTVETSDLHEPTRIMLPAAAGPLSHQPAQIECHYAYNARGQRTQSRLLQANPDPASGGAKPFDHLDFDIVGNLQAVHSVNDASAAPAQASFAYDSGDRMVGTFPFDVKGGVCASGGAGAQRDERGYSSRLLHGIAPGPNPQPVIEDKCGWTDSGQFDSVTEAGATTGYQIGRDGIGLPNTIVDPLSYAFRGARDDGAQTNRIAVEQNATVANVGPALLGAQVRMNESGRAGRIHHYSFVPSTNTSAAPAAPEYMGPPALWAPQIGTLLQGGLWGVPFGCRTTDSVSDAWDLPTRIVGDELGFTLVMRDTHGRPADVTLWSGATADDAAIVRETSYEYDAAGHAKTVTIEDSPSMPSVAWFTCAYGMEYDAQGNIARVLDADGNARRKEYDETGHVYASYDAMGQQPGLDGNLTTYARDGLGHVTKTETTLTIDGKGGSARDTSNPYNSAGTVAIEMEYSDDGRPLKSTDRTDAGTFVTEWNYVPYGRLEFIKYADGTTFQYTYDAATGRVQSTTDPNRNVLSYTYEDARMKSVLCQGSGYAYDFDAATVTISAAQSGGGPTLSKGRAIQLVYDSHRRVVQDIQDGVTVECDRSGLGQRTLKYPAAHGDVVWKYDNIGRLRSILDRGTEVARFEYSGPSRVITRTQRGLRYDCTYTGNVPRFTGMTITGVAQGTVLVEYSMQRDAMNRITKRTRTAGGVSETRQWTYDSAGRITHEILTPNPAQAPGPLNTDLKFDGDTVLRELKRDEVRGGVIVSNATVIDQSRTDRGRVVSRSGVNLGYDNNGNLTSDGQQTYSYDGFDRLTGVITAKGQSIVFEYDGMNRVISRTNTATGAREEYIYDGWHLIEVRDPAAAGSVKERYVYGGDLDDIISVEKGGHTYQLLYTPEGYVDALVDSQNDVVERYNYDLFGNVTVCNAAGTPQPNAIPQSRFLFQRRYYDSETGLYDHRQRWYSAMLGFFITPDPSGFAQGPNLYCYCGGDPVNCHDPFGREQTWSEWWDEKKAELKAAAGGFVEGLGDGGYVVANAFTAGQVSSLSKEANKRAAEYGKWGTAMKVTAGIGAGAAYLAGGLVVAEGLGITAIGSAPLSTIPGTLSAGASSLANATAQALTRACGAVATRVSAAVSPLLYRLFDSGLRLSDKANSWWEWIPGKVRGLIEGALELYGAPVTPQGLLNMSGAPNRRGGVIGFTNDEEFRATGKSDLAIAAGTYNAKQKAPFPGSNTVVVHGPGEDGVEAGRVFPTPFRSGSRDMTVGEVVEGIASHPDWDKGVPTTLAACSSARDRRVAQAVANGLVQRGAQDPRLRAPTTDVRCTDLSLFDDEKGEKGRWLTFLGLVDR